MSDNCTPRHPFIEVLPGPKGVKRSGSHGDPDSESLGLGKPAKRAKSSKACHTCRQQKTRCEPNIATPERSLRCSRCTRFNIECSFDRSPPPMVMPHGFPTTSTPSDAAPARHRTEFPTDSSSKSAIVPQTPSSPSILSHPRSEYEQRPPHPITPLSPPRSNLNLDETQTPMDMATTTHYTWSHNNTNSTPEQWAAPLSFTRELIEGSGQSTSTKQKTTTADDLVARGVVSVDEAGPLSQIWKNRFAPWLPIEQAYSRMSDASAAAASSTTDQRKEREAPASSAFLQAAQWTLAARRLPSLPGATAVASGASNAKSSLFVRLVQALQQGITRASLGLDLSIPALRALLILAAWSTNICNLLMRNMSNEESKAEDVHEFRAFDGEMLISTAVHITTQMHLELDVEAALSQVKANRKRKSEISELDVKLLDRARTMLAVSAANTMLNLGKGRLCSSTICLEHAEQIFGSPSVLANRPGGDGDACMVYQCNLLVIALRMADRCTNEVVRGIGPDAWTQRTREDLQALDHLQQTLATTSALTSPNEIIPITTVILQFHFLKINAIFRAFRTLFQVFPEFKSISASFRQPGGASCYMPPLLRGDPYDHGGHLTPSDRRWNGNANNSSAGLTEHHMAVKPLVHEWGSKSKESTESLMATSLVLHRLHAHPLNMVETNFYPITYAPDYTLFSILFGASYTVKVQTMMIFLTREASSSTEITRSILDRVLAMFREASSDGSPTHATPSLSLTPTEPLNHPLAYRCANALSALIKLWDARIKDMFANVPTTNTDHESSPRASPEPDVSSTPAEGEPRDSRRPRSPPIASISSYKGDAALSSSAPSLTTLPTPYPVSHTRSGNDSEARHHYTPAVDLTPSLNSPAQQQHEGISSATYSVQGELFGLPPNFDIAPFYDPAFMFDGFDFGSAQRRA